MKLLLLFLAFTLPMYADPTFTIDKTPRMAAIETKYHMTIAGVLRHGKVDFWVFMCDADDALFRQFPVVVLKNAVDHDVDVAIIAARNCAAFYDSQFKPLTPKPAASPSPSAFTVPTHPLGEVRI